MSEGIQQPPNGIPESHSAETYQVPEAFLRYVVLGFECYQGLARVDLDIASTPSSLISDLWMNTRSSTRSRLPTLTSSGPDLHASS